MHSHVHAGGSGNLVFLLMQCWLCGSSQARWSNPSERYADAYKRYASAECPIAEDGIKHFVYFARDRQAIHDHPFLDNPRFAGAQIMYPWSQLEPSKGQYDFSTIEEDYEYLKLRGRSFHSIAGSTFSSDFRATPPISTLKGMTMDQFYRGQMRAFRGMGGAMVECAKEFALLLRLGEAFDGKIEGINLQETSIGVSADSDKSFNPALYVESIKANMLALKEAFPRSAKLQYTNFMPGEWLPWDDKGYLRAIYHYGEEIEVGLGAPDLMVQRKGQLNHALAMMHEHEYTVPRGIAVQDGNYIGLTGADFSPGSDLRDASGSGIGDRENFVPLLHAFAGLLKVQYMFW